ncbi:MAG: hypothetical protein AAF995_10445 [Planctomycetota bacterium]
MPTTARRPIARQAACHRSGVRRSGVRGATPRAAAFALAALALCLGACGQLTVEVRNESSRPVLVRLLQNRMIHDPDDLASAQISAGQTRILGPVKLQPLEPTELVVEQSGSMGDVPPKVRVYAGRSTALIEDAPSSSWHDITVRLLERPGRKRAELEDPAEGESQGEGDAGD